MVHWVVAAEPNALVAIEGNTFIANKTLSADNTAVLQTLNSDTYLYGSSNGEYDAGFHALAPNATVRIQRNSFEVLDPSVTGYNTINGVVIARLAATAPNSAVHCAGNTVRIPPSVSSILTFKFGLRILTGVVSGCGAVLNISSNDVSISSDVALNAYGIAVHVINVANAGLLSVDGNRIDVYGTAASPLSIPAGTIASFGLLRVSNNRMTAHHASPTVPFAVLSVALSGWGQVLFEGNAAVSAVVPTVMRPLLQGVLSGGGAPNDVQAIGNTWYGAAAVASPAFSVSGTAVAHTDLSQTTPFFLRRHACRDTSTASTSFVYTGGTTTSTATASKTGTVTPSTTLTSTATPESPSASPLVSPTATPHKTVTLTAPLTPTHVGPVTPTATPSLPATHTVTPDITKTIPALLSPTHSASRFSSHSAVIAATLTHAPPPTATSPVTATHAASRRTHTPSTTPEASATTRCEPPEHHAAAVVVPMSALVAAAPMALRFAAALPALASPGPALVPTWAGDADVAALLAGSACRPSADTLVCGLGSANPETLVRLRTRLQDGSAAAVASATILLAGDAAYCELDGQRVRAVVELRVAVVPPDGTAQAAVVAVLQRAVPAAIALAYVFEPTAVEPALVTLALEGPCSGPALKSFARLAVPVVNPFAGAVPDAAGLLQAVLAAALSLACLAAAGVAHRRASACGLTPPDVLLAACAAARFPGSALWACLVCAPGIALGTGLAVRAVTGPGAAPGLALASAAVGAATLVAIPAAAAAVLYRVPALRLARYEEAPVPASWLRALVTPGGRWAPAAPARALGGATALLRAHLGLVPMLHVLASAAMAALVTAPPGATRASCAGRLAAAAALLAGLGATAAVLRPYRVPLHNALSCAAGLAGAAAVAAAASGAGNEDGQARLAAVVATVVVCALTFARAALAAWAWLAECRDRPRRHAADAQDDSPLQQLI